MTCYTLSFIFAEQEFIFFPFLLVFLHNSQVASMCNPLGNAVGQIMPSIFVSKRNDLDDDANATIDGIPDLMVAQCSLALITLLLNYLFFVNGKHYPIYL
jgi:hypothetical protein